MTASAEHDHAWPAPTMNENLSDLARVAATGDPAATASLLRVLTPRLVRVVRAVLGATHPDVDDAAQLALIAFVQALPAYRGESDPFGYGRIIAVRTAIAVRKRSRAHAVREDGGTETEAIAEGAPLPCEQVTADQRRELLRDLLTELPTEQAEALAMRVVLGCSLEEVALHAGVPINTIRSRVRLAKERLKSRIEGDTRLRDALAPHAMDQTSQVTS